MPGSIKVVSKAVAVLEHLAQRGALNAADLSEQLSEPRPSVYRLLETLELHDLVERTERRGYFELGPKVLNLAATVMEGYDHLIAVARPVMERLNDGTGQTVFLCVRRGLDALCVERINGQLVQLMVLPVGGSIPLHGGSIARALLAFEPKSLWEEFVADGPLKQFTEMTPTTKQELFRQLEEARTHGLVISDSDVIPGIASIGAPILGSSGAVHGSISVSGPRPLVLGDEVRAIEEKVLTSAAEIANGL